MKKLVAATTMAVALAFSTTGASADELGGQATKDGNLSASQLAEMGLGGMTAMSDDQGNQIRGNGFVLVFGFSYAAGGTPDRYIKSDYSSSGPVFKAGRSSSSGPGAWARGGSFAYAR